MKSVIMGLATMAVVTFASDNYYGNASVWDSYEISVNWNEINETANSIAQKWDEYNKYEKKTSREAARDLARALEDTYKDSVGKIVMEWGETVGPLVDHVGEAFDNSTMKGNCDAECGVKCWDAKRFDTKSNNWQYGFNVTCFRACGCEFKLDKKQNNKTKEQFERAARKIENDLEDFVEYGQKVAKDAEKKIIPALDRYNNKTAQIMNEYLKTVRATAINDLGCNSTCVNRCTNGYTTCFFELSSCISQCTCANLDEVIHLEKGRYNYPQLMLYAKGSQRAINTFFRNKDLI